MKNKRKARPLFASLFLAALLAACSMETGEGAARISVYGGSRPPKVGETLQAANSGRFSGDFIWEWSIKRDDSPWREITVLSDEYPYNYGTLSGGNDSKFTIGSDLVDFYIRVKRKTKAVDNAQSVWIYGEILGRVQNPAN
ncbi:MAG: hypothetical protein LBC53_03995 [Spirochaetaceae bacterium]|jgi:hypothetical protein|nr:hypothetical protein [Spirochaetaceae bacterium]